MLNLRKTSMDLNVKYEINGGDVLDKPLSYRQLVGRINYLLLTRPNISHAIQTVSQFVNIHVKFILMLSAKQFVILYIPHLMSSFSATSPIFIHAYADELAWLS